MGKVRQPSGEQSLLTVLRNEKPSQERNFLAGLQSSCPAVLSVSCTNRTCRKVACAPQDEMNNLIFFLCM